MNSEWPVLCSEYDEYIRKLRNVWLARKRSYFNDVYEVMNPQQRAQVQKVIDDWATYITPLAEAWWRERGYEIIWPEDNSEPTTFRKIEVVDTASVK